MDRTYRERQAALFEALPDSIETVMLTPSTSLQYLTGLAMRPSDRPVVTILSRQHRPAVVLARPGRQLVEDQLGTDVEVHPYTDSVTPARACRDAVAEVLEDRGPLGAVAVEYWSTRLVGTDFVEGLVDWDDVERLDPYISEIRARKDDDELDNLRRACETIDAVLESVVQRIEAGMTEAEIERMIRREILESDADGVGTLFVVSGARTASPWAQTSDRTVRRGEPIMMDVGTVYQGYYSDVTRTYSLGEPDDDEWTEIYGIVQEAARDARTAVEAGVPAREIDGAARTVIEAAGYGDQFPHRLGHGLGLGVHERPVIVDDNDAPLAAGNVFALEPGIYLDGIGGVRIEDNVAVTETGVEVLSTADRSLRVI
jgi:Xaa-Pro aminopeptidase